MFTTTLLAAILSSPPQAPEPPQAPAARNYDLYHARSYAELYRYAERGIPVVLYVGVPDASAGRYETHWRAPAGFMGLASGTYHYSRDTAGRVVQTSFVPAAGVPAVPFTVPPPPTPTTPATTVPHAAGYSFGYPGLTPTAATTTGAPRAGRFGTTNCST